MRRRYRARRTLLAYAFLAPNLLAWAVFLGLPCLMVVYWSFRDGGVLGSSSFVGLDNWREAFGDDQVRATLGNTVQYVLMAIPLALGLGLLVALALREARRGGTVVRTVVYLPVLMPAVIAGLIWLFVIHPQFGLSNIVVEELGGTPLNWRGDPSLALPMIVMLEVWRGFGFWALLFLAALTSLPRTPFQAAELDGAGRLRRFWHLTLPLLKPTFLLAAILATIVNFQLFDTVFILTNGGPVNATATVAWYVHKSLFEFNRVGYGATVSVLLLGCILLLTFLQFRLLDRRRR
jgi:ABC-type sugar transport system permease subunit